jgi:four helix bundle protein
MRKPNIIKDKSFAFALRIIQAYKALQTEQKEYVLSKQLLRSGTAIGALVRESENAASTKDFLNKLTVALKEADETQYWLELLFHAEYISEGTFSDFNKDCRELIGILVASVKTLKGKLGM